MKKNKKTLTILIIACFIYLMIKPENSLQKKLLNSTNEETASKEVKDILKLDSLKAIKDKTLLVKNDENRLILVVDKEYLYVDLNREIPKIYHFQANIPKIEARILRIEEGGFIINHEGHEDYIKGPVPDGKRVGDIVAVDDPHTHLTSLGDEKIEIYETKKIKDTPRGLLERIKYNFNSFISSLRQGIRSIFK